MKKIISCLSALLGLTSACGQQNFENVGTADFADLATDASAVVLDVRTAEEFGEGHLERAINIDVNQSDFLQKAQAALPTDKTIAVYCRSGRRSAKAAGILADNGFKPVNLEGGITAWKKAGLPVTTVDYEVDVFKTKSGKTLKFYALMHASIRMVYDGKEIEIDPVNKLGNRTTDYSAMPKADYIFVTHEHGDHFDKDALQLLQGEKTVLVTNQRCAGMLGYGQTMANGDKRQLASDIAVEAVPAYNTTEGHLQFHPKGRDNGYVLTIDGLRIYIAGDTEDIPEMSALGDIDIAVLPCNQPYTMTTTQLVSAARMVKPKVLFPYHYGQTDVRALPAQLQADGIDARIRHYE